MIYAYVLGNIHEKLGMNCNVMGIKTPGILKNPPIYTLTFEISLFDLTFQK